MPGLSHANSEELRGLRIGGLADCGLEPASGRFRAFGPPRGPLSWADSESARKSAQNAPLGSFRGQL
eukprot:14524427-Alexandrium_andersonii.AAC.1